MESVIKPQPPLSRRQVITLGAALPLTAALSSCWPGGGQATPSKPEISSWTPGWRTIWEDRFDQGYLDSASWTALDYGGNRDLGEQQYNDPAMVSVDGGNMVLRARRNTSDGFAYTAGSISTKGKVALGPHGRLTTRQYLSPGDGIGVGVCLYGVNIDHVGWPACGEIDATEIAISRGDRPFASVHGPGYSGGSPISAIRHGDSLINRWVEHSLEWAPGRIAWAIDGDTYHVAEATDPKAAAGWPFEQPFFVTIVMTVGSKSSGPVNHATWPRDEKGNDVDPYAVFEFIRFEQKMPG